MKSEKYYAVVLLIAIAVLFLLTCLLDIAWIQAQWVRQVLVYGIMVLVVFAVWKNLRSNNQN